MAHASLSIENLIASGLRSIDCSIRNFTEIAVSMGIQVSHVLISTCLNGTREFNYSTGERLGDLLKELLELREYYKDFPFSWSAHEKIATLVVRRRAEIAIAEVDAAVAAKG
jgi:hypothetical protein